jgi:hypothetical protein
VPYDRRPTAHTLVKLYRPEHFVFEGHIATCSRFRELRHAIPMALMQMRGRYTVA